MTTQPANKQPASKQLTTDNAKPARARAEWATSPESTHRAPLRLRNMPRALTNHGARRERASDQLESAEVEAREVAQRAASGSPVHIPGAEDAPPLLATEWGSGEPLPAALREVLEAAFGASLDSVRLHTEGSVAALVLGLHTRALTIGERIAFAPGTYEPGTEDGRTLIAHEVAHVLQQRVAGHPSLQFEDPTTTAERPIYLRVSMSGIVVSSPGRTLDPGRPVRSQLFALVLRRIVTNYTPGLEDDVLPRLPDTVIRSGGFTNEHPATGNEPVREMTVSRVALSEIIQVLRDLGHQDFLLTEEQLEVLNLGAAAARWYAVQHRLGVWDPWYTYPLFEVHVAMHGALLQRLLRADAAVASARESGSQAEIDQAQDAYFDVERELLQKLDAPLLLLEMIRTDATLMQDEEAGAVWMALWGESLRPTPRTLARIDIAERVINFYWRQPEVGRAAVTDREQRVEFLQRFARWVLRVRPDVTAADVTQRLVDQPSEATDPPFPATLHAYPPPHGAANAVPARTERRFAFNVIFPDVFSAFTHYQYAWDVIRHESDPQPSSESPTPETAAEAGSETRTDAPPPDPELLRITSETDAASSAIEGIEARGENAVREMEGGQRASMVDILGSRLARDMDYAAADIRRINQTLGPTGVAVSPYYLNALVLRPLGTVIRSILDLITLSGGPGNREHPIEFPDTGIYIVRVAAMPQVDDAAEIRRPPSVAYMAVFAQDERDFARVQLEESVDTTREADEQRAEYTQTLTELIAEEEDAELRDMLRELLREAEREASFWPRAHAMKERLDTRIAEMDTEIARLRRERPTGQRAQAEHRATVQLLQQERDRMDRERTQFQQLLDTRAGRIADYPALTSAASLYIGFVGDNGQAMQLTMEWAAIAREDAAFSARANAPVGSSFVVVSDHTTPNSGVRQGVGADPDTAITAAVRAILESRMGYGRGQASIRLPSGHTETLRIEADFEAITSEAIENISLVITVASVAAAPFTGGSSLTILVPLGIVSGGHAAYRMYTRHEASTLRWDMQTATDLVDIVGAVVAGGALVRGARSGMAASRFGRMIAVSYQFAEEGTGYLLLGLGLEQQLQEIERNENMSDGEKRARRMMALGSAMLQAGIMVGQRVFKQGADDLRTIRRDRTLPEGTPNEGTASGDRTGTTESAPARELPAGDVAPPADTTTTRQPATPASPDSTARPPDAPQTDTVRTDTPHTDAPQATDTALSTQRPAPRDVDAPSTTPEAAPPQRTTPDSDVRAPRAEADTAAPSPERTPRTRSQLEEAVGALIGPGGRFTDPALEAAYSRYTGPADRARWAWRTGGEPLDRLRSLLGEDFRPPRTTVESPATRRPVAEATDADLRRRVGDPMNPRDREATAELERRYQQLPIRQLVQMARRRTRWDGYYARLVLDQRGGQRGTVTEYLAEVRNLDQLRQMAQHDPAAAQALAERYRDLSPAQLERLASDGDGTAAQVLRHPPRGPAMDADAEARLTERVWDQRRSAMEDAELEASRATDPAARAAAQARGARARSEGTVGALESDIPGIPQHVVRGSPRSPAEVDAGQQRHVRPQTDVALAQYHAEEQLLNWLITQIEGSSIPPETLSGRRVRIVVDQQVCSYCLSGVASGEHSGTLVQFSQRYPGLRLEITDIRTGDFVVFQGGQRTVHNRRAGTLDD